jgi:hypothetical protein
MEGASDTNTEVSDSFLWKASATGANPEKDKTSGVRYEKFSESTFRSRFFDDAKPIQQRLRKSNETGYC